MSNEHYEPPISRNELFFQPEDFGLDLENEADAQLYIESSGYRSVAKVLLDRRKLRERFATGTIPEDRYHEFEARLETDLAAAWSEVRERDKP